MEVAEPLGHAELVRGLWRAARAGRLPHALLFEGPRGVGRFLAARWFALGLVCTRGPGDPCRECGPCKRVLSGGWRGNHPDVHLVDPIEEGVEAIKVGRITPRESDDEPEQPVRDFLRLRAHESAWRVVIVREADRMNPNAQNALLKTLEEPSAGTLLVIETARPDRLLPTIRSRCVPVQFAPLSLGDALDALVRQGVPPERAEHFARWGRGAPGTALLLAERGGDDLRALFAAVAVGELAPHEAARAVWDLPGEYPGDKVPVVARGRARFVCDFALDVAGDLLRASVGSEPRDLAHGDLAARVGATEPVARRLADALVEARADVDRNLAPEAAVERLMLAFADLAPLRSPPAASARVR